MQGRVTRDQRTQETDDGLRGEVLAVEARLRQAVLARDREAATALLSDGFVAIGHAGNVVGKEAYLDIHFDPARRFTRFDTSEQVAAPVAGVALVTGRVEMFNAAAASHPPPTRFTAIYEPGGPAGWLIRAWQETSLDERAAF